jgi:hypothetical protein
MSGGSGPFSQASILSCRCAGLTVPTMFVSISGWVSVVHVGRSLVEPARQARPLEGGDDFVRV